MCCLNVFTDLPDSHLSLLPLDLVDPGDALGLELGLPEVGVGQRLRQLTLYLLKD